MKTNKVNMIKIAILVLVAFLAYNSISRGIEISEAKKELLEAQKPSVVDTISGNIQKLHSESLSLIEEEKDLKEKLAEVKKSYELSVWGKRCSEKQLNDIIIAGKTEENCEVNLERFASYNLKK